VKDDRAARSQRRGKRAGLHPVGLMLLILALLGSTGAIASDPEEHYASASQLNASVANPINGVAVSVVPSRLGVIILLARRDRSGEAEIHMTNDDEIVAREGCADLLVGGKAEGLRAVSENEYRGSSLEGAHSYRVCAGDVMFIPAGKPHQVRLRDGASFSYLTIKMKVQE